MKNTNGINEQEHIVKRVLTIKIQYLTMATNIGGKIDLGGFALLLLAIPVKNMNSQEACSELTGKAHSELKL